MQTYETKLKPKGFIHTFPSSNTLFGAICWGIRAIHGEKRLEDFLSSFDLNPLILTSSFPLLQNQERNFSLRFFPKPKLPSLGLKETEGEIKAKSQFQVASEYKSFKKLAFLSEGLFGEVLKGKGEGFLFSEYLEGKIKKAGNMALKKEELGKLQPKGNPPPKSFPRARNKVDRLISSSTGTGELFYEFKLPLPPEMSLFFLLKTENVGFFKPVLRFLEDNGIGGERSIGVNHFSIEIPDKESELNLSFPSKGKKLVTLSRWKVDAEELDMDREDEFRYELLPLRGKLETGFDFKDKGIVWKRKTLYFAEGSVLVAKREGQSHYGGLWNSLKDVELNGKEIKDYGIAFPAFFKEGE